MANLGKLDKIDDLRTVWKHEASGFSKWLAEEENIAKLSAEIGMDINPDELESSVGPFSVDIYASEVGTNRKIVIENQLEETDHKHLGQTITYAAGKDAEVVIWIVKHARDEHRQAVDWLNTHTDENIGFFLIEIELWKIGDSLPAPKFNVVSRPNDWAKAMKLTNALSEGQKTQLEFWQGFVEYASQKPEYSKLFNKRKPLAQNWYDLAVGSSEYHINLLANVQNKKLGAEIYIVNNKEIFQQFESHKEEIEGELGFNMDWRLIPEAKASRITVYKTGDIRQQDKWDEHFDWLIDKAVKLKQTFPKYM